jgi:formate hydrogenlyase subunit 6/NADH:ubiquinone oxidoreductase subunit I
MKRPGQMLRQVLESLVSRPATVRYPFEKIEMPEKFRGRLKFCAEKCIGCKMCVRDCPSGAIAIRKVGDKQFEADIDLSKCIYCAQCVDSCTKDALEATRDFELAQLSRQALRITCGREACAVTPAAPKGPDTPNDPPPGNTPPTA